MINALCLEVLAMGQKESFDKIKKSFILNVSDSEMQLSKNNELCETYYYSTFKNLSSRFGM